MKRKWNNGNLALLPEPMNREKVQQRITIAAPIREVFSWASAATEPGWIRGWRPFLRCSESGHNEQYAFWTESSFAGIVFDRPELVTRWYTTDLDEDTHRFEAFFALAPAGSNGVAGNAVVGTLAIDLEAAGDQETAARLELVCLSLSEAGNALFDSALGHRMRGLLQRIGEASLQAAEPARGPKRPLYRSGFPRRRPVRATHQVTVHLDDTAMNLEEAFDLACPVAELDWIERWSFDLLQSESGRNERHCVFLEAMSAPFVLAESGKTHWTTVVFDRERRRFSAVLATGNLLLGLFEFSAEDLGDGRAVLRWDLTYAGTSARGDALLSEPGTRKRMGEMLEGLQIAVVHYIRTKTLYHSPISRKVTLVGFRLAARAHRHLRSHYHAFQRFNCGVRPAVNS